MPLKRVPANQDGTQSEESFVNINSLFKPNPQPAVLVEPGEGPFNDPSLFPKSAAMFGVPAGQEGLDAPFPKTFANPFGIVGPVSECLAGSLAWTANLSAYGRYLIHQVQRFLGIMPIGSGDSNHEWMAFSICEKVTFGAFFSLICGIRTRLGPPKRALTFDPSITTRSRLIFPLRRSSVSKTPWIFFQTPTFCQSRSRRQQVIPDPQPNSGGSISQGIPLLRTNKMPLRAFRAGTTGLPLRFRGGSGGIKGSKSLQSLSGRNSWGIRPSVA